jgi:hypothetical protein
MDCARLDEPRDPEVGGWHAIRLRFGIPGLGLEHLAEAAVNELIFALTPERYFASSVDARFRHDEERHPVGPSRRHMDTDSAAHAVTHDAAAAQSQGIDEGNDRSGVILSPVPEVRWPVAVSMAKEIDQEGTAPSQRSLHRCRHQLAGR